MKPLRILIVEDEALLAMELEALIEDSGHVVVGWATSSREAQAMIETLDADLAFVDIHLSDGPTGVAVGSSITAGTRSLVVFVTANPRRIPDDYAGAVGVMAKPFTSNGVAAALRYLAQGVREPPPRAMLPAGFTLAPSFAANWAPAT